MGNGWTDWSILAGVREGQRAVVTAARLLPAPAFASDLCQPIV
jgi:hypothetical protein